MDRQAGTAWRNWTITPPCPAAPSAGAHRLHSACGRAPQPRHCLGHGVLGCGMTHSACRSVSGKQPAACQSCPIRPGSSMRHPQITSPCGTISPRKAFWRPRSARRAGHPSCLRLDCLPCHYYYCNTQGAGSGGCSAALSSRTQLPSAWT